MSTGLKKQWGLEDAKAPPSTAQADNFKAAYQAELNRINSALQYTVVNAEKSKHNEKAAGRDKLNSTYQVVLTKIKPNNPAAAKCDIDNALAAAKKTGDSISAFKTDVEKAVAAWRAKEPTFEKAISMVEELETWGHKQAATLRAAVGKIQEQVNSKLWMPAVTAVDALMTKLQPIYDEYLRQKEAKAKYDAALLTLQPKLSSTAQSKYQSLATQQTDMLAIQGQMEAAAKDLDFIKALQLVTDLATKVEAFLKAVADLEKKKAEYEQALAELQPRLNDIATCEHAKLATMQQDMIAQEDQMKAAAKDEDFEQALILANGLSTKVDAFIADRDTLDRQKKAYEDALATLKPKLDKVATLPEYEKFAPQKKEIDIAKGQMETSAKDEHYDEALKLAGELSSKVDAYATSIEDLEKKRNEYEQGWAALKPKLPTSSTPASKKVVELELQLAPVQGDMEKAAEAKDYDQAVTLLADLTKKFDEYTKAKEEFDKQKSDYEAGLALLQPKITAASESQTKHADLAPLQLESFNIQKEMEAAAAALDYEKALKLLTDLAAKLDEYFAAIEKKKKDYETARDAALDKLDGCLVTARDFSSLSGDRTALDNKKKDMEAKAASEDYVEATKLATELEALAVKYLKDAADKQKTFDETGQKVVKELDAAEWDLRDDVARDWVNNKLTAEDMKYIPTAVRNRLVEEMKEGNFEDVDEEAIKKLYSVRTLDPKFEEVEMKHRRKLVEALKNDPEVQKAKKDWASMTPDKKVELIQKVAKHHVDAYGTEKIEGAPAMTFDTSNEGFVDGSIEMGSYNHGTGKLTINTHSDNPALKSFGAAVDLGTHESAHRYQNLLAGKARKDEIPKTDPLYDQAQAFKLNTGDGYVREPFHVYENQPKEAHSRITGDEVKKAVN